MALVTTKPYWIIMLLRDLGLSLLRPPTLWCDNLGTFSLAFNYVFHARTQHIKLDFHFIHEKVANKDIQLYFITNAAQLANLFTIGLASFRVQFLFNNLLY